MFNKFLLPLFALLLCINPLELISQNPGDVVITEIMYDSPGTDDEWIELYNATGSNIKLDSKWQLTYGSNTFNFAGQTITAGGYLTVGLGSDGDGTFNDQNPFTPDISVIGTPIASVDSTDRLSNTGAQISLVYDPSGSSTTVDDLTYSKSSPWSSEANGNGPTLELILYTLDNSSGSNWQKSVSNGGSPGINNSKYLTSNTASPDITNSSHWDFSAGNAAPGSEDNVTVSSGHTLTIISNVTIKDLSVSGSVAFNSGTSSIRSLILSSGATATNAGTLSLSGITQNSGSTITLGGNVNMNQGGTCEITGGNVTFSGNVDVDNNTTVNVNGAITVKISDDASLLQTSGSFTGTNIVIDRAGENSDMSYNIWCSPISSASLTGTFVGANPCDMYIWDQTDQSWTYDYASGFSTTCNGSSVTFGASNVISGGDGIMDVGRGYYAPGKSTPTRGFTGTPNNGTINVSMGTSGDAWNLIGNPYPSAIDLDAVITTNTGAFDGNFYFWADDGSSGSGYSTADFATYNSSGGTTVNSKEAKRYCGSGQGFWVKATSGTFTFNNTHRTSSNNDNFLKTQNNTNIKRAWFSINGLGHNNQILIAFTGNASDTYDPNYDAPKMEGNPRIYLASTLDSNDYSIQGLSKLSIGVDKTIGLNVKVGESGMYYLKLDNAENFSQIPSIILEDTEREKFHDIVNGGYNVYLDSTADNRNRFVLHFKQMQSGDTSSVSIAEKVNPMNHISVLTLDESIQLITKESGKNFTKIQVINTLGTLIEERSNIDKNQVRIDKKYSSGMYFIKSEIDGEKMNPISFVIH